MTQSRWLKSSGLAFVLLVTLATAAFAQAPARTMIAAPVIVVVDPQTVVQQSKAGQAIRQQHDKYLQSYEAEVQANRKELSEAEAELTKQKNVMPFIEWQKKAQAFDQRLTTFNQKYNKINQSVEKSYIAAMNDLGKAITQVTSELASDLGANLVLPTQQVILHDPRMDLTKMVIERMDIKYPSIAFPSPEGSGGESAKKGPDPSGKK